MKKRILFLVNHEIVIFNFRKELVFKLLSEGFEVFICSPSGKKIDYFIEKGCKFIELDFNRHGTNPISDLFLIYKYIQIIKKIRPLAVLTYTIKPNIYGGIACRLTKKNCISNITGLGTAVESAGIMQKITITLYKIAFRHINMVFFQNKENMDFFITHGIQIPNYKLLPGSGVNLQEYVPLEYPDSTITKFVFISRIMKEKGIDQYLNAAEFIKLKYPNTEFHICGFCEEKYEDTLHTYQSKGIIEYHGLMDDIRDVLKFTHCTIHPTYYPEGMSNVLLESCACARPIITTDRSGCKEIVKDGVNGFIVVQRDTSDLIKRIEQFLTLDLSQKKQMGLEGRKLVMERFDRSIIVKEYLDTIKSIPNVEIGR